MVKSTVGCNNTVPHERDPICYNFDSKKTKPLSYQFDSAPASTDAGTHQIFTTKKSPESCDAGDFKPHLGNTSEIGETQLTSIRRQYMV